MSRKSTRSLEDSWIVNEDIDDGDISWAGDDGESDGEHVHPLKPSPRVTRSTGTETQAPPELIMPSINQNLVQPRQRTAARQSESNTTPARQSRAQATASRKTAAKPAQRRQTNQDDDLGFVDRVLSIVGDCFWAMVEILGDALKLLKKPISFFVAGYVILIFAQFTQNFLTNSIYSALSPICRIPGTGLLNLPMCRPYGENHPRLPAGASAPDPEFDALMTVQGQFETIMEDTSAGMSLPMDMKRSETSIRDLRQLVRFSQLPSRHELMHEFDGFIETARIASYDLQKFNSHVGRGVDQVLSTARWTQRVLDDISHEQEQRGVLPAFISDTLLAPFRPLKFTESRLLDQYIQHSHIISGEIERLVEEAQALLQTLQNIEDRLDVIHSISLRDHIKAQGSKDEILADLWTYLGANRAKQRNVNSQIKLLGQVSDYRRLAFNHIANTIIKLQGMSAELEELRSRVSSAAVLDEAGIKHVPLAVHIENIQLGVERLEIGRERARELEQRHTRRILDRADSGSVEGLKYLPGT